MTIHSLSKAGIKMILNYEDGFYYYKNIGTDLRNLSKGIESHYEYAVFSSSTEEIADTFTN